jgi:6-phosphogluconolactonase
MIEAEWRAYDTTAEMADAVADEIGYLIEGALEARDEAFIALPGGKTPLPIFERLAAKKIDWNRVTIIPTDDRLVSITDPLSNAATIAHHFMP